MVKFRGIAISIVSQFDICKLPEFRPPASPSPDPFTTMRPPPPSQPTASCYVPIYPGSQIWFEYSVDGPHPENAAYFFKLLNNGQVTTSWDCTAKYGHCGKAAYALEYVGDDEVTGENLVKRQAFRFRIGEGEVAEPGKGKGKLNDCIEIRVHRIEHRQRIAVNGEIAASFAANGIAENAHLASLRLVHSGLVQAYSPKRRYRYQLLDPVDEPYATFRFYYRTYEFLEDNNIITYDDDASNYGQSSCVSEENLGRKEKYCSEEMADQAVEAYASPMIFRTSKDPQQPNKQALTAAAVYQVLQESSEDTTSEDEIDGNAGGYPTDSDSETSLRLVIKDSIEDLPSSVPRSPKSDNTLKQSPGSKSSVLTSPSKVPKASPKKLQKKELTVNLGGTEFDLDKKRPLSPFDSSGILRRIVNPIPPSAPATMTEFGPTIWDEVEEKQRKVEARVEKEQAKVKAKDKGCERTTRADRGGKSLMGFLGRRFARVE